MKESTYLRIFHNWKRGKDTVLSKYKYSILFAPLMNAWYFIRADKNDENWDWHKPCPDCIQVLIDPSDRNSLHPNAFATETIDEGYSSLFGEAK